VGAALAQLDHVDAVLEDRAAIGRQAVQIIAVDRIGDLTRIRVRLDQVGEVRFHLGEPGPQARCKRGADFVKGMH
jgi:hypothetical protein